MSRRLLKSLVFLVLLLNILSTAFIIYQTEKTIHTVTAEAINSNTGEVSFCLNRAPTLTVPCSTNLSQDQPYFCQLNASDPDGVNFTFFLSPQPPDNVSIFNLSNTGVINFTPTNNDTGNHSVLLGIDDNSGCDNAYAYSLFSFTVANINDPPYLIKDIPNQKFSANTTLYALFLTDYFADPDDDPLTYSFIRDTSTMTLNVTINPDSSLVLYSAQCGKAYLKFIATDPYNLSATSNIVEVESKCDVSDNGGESSDDSSAGGGGGGGVALLCKPEMICLPWSECYPNGLQVQVCKDKNGCTDDEVKFHQNCTYKSNVSQCKENWLCSEWSVCSIDSMQNRTCEDLERCQTTHYRPVLEQPCVYNPTCDDGVKNGNETGIDCGGECKPCLTIQQPNQILTKSTSLFTFFWILVLLILLALFTLYREKVYEGLTELGWFFTRHHRKEILLTSEEKSVIFEQLNLLDKNGYELAEATRRLSAIIRIYFSFALHLVVEHDVEARRLALQRSDSNLKNLLEWLSTELEAMDLGEGKVKILSLGKNHSFELLKEEFRLLTCMTSDYTLKEVAREIPERKITDELSFEEEIRVRLINSYEALQFQQVEFAKEEYIRILKAYDSSPLKEREGLYASIGRLYNEINYVAETQETEEIAKLQFSQKSGHSKGQNQISE